MIPIDFEQARAAHRALEQFFAAHPKGRLEPDALVDVRVLCRVATNAAPEAECRRAIRSIENYSDLLSSGDTARVRGADFVRLRVQNALASFRSKLKAIEASDTVTAA